MDKSLKVGEDEWSQRERGDKILRERKRRMYKAILLEPLWASKFPSQYFMQLYIHDLNVKPMVKQLYIHDLNVKPMAKLEKKSYATYHAYSVT